MFLHHLMVAWAPRLSHKRRASLEATIYPYSLDSLKKVICQLKDNLYLDCWMAITRVNLGDYSTLEIYVARVSKERLKPFK